MENVLKVNVNRSIVDRKFARFCNNVLCVLLLCPAGNLEGLSRILIQVAISLAAHFLLCDHGRAPVDPRIWVVSLQLLHCEATFLR